MPEKLSLLATIWTSQNSSRGKINKTKHNKENKTTTTTKDQSQIISCQKTEQKFLRCRRMWFWFFVCFRMSSFVVFQEKRLQEIFKSWKLWNLLLKVTASLVCWCDVCSHSRHVYCDNGCVRNTCPSCNLAVKCNVDYEDFTKVSFEWQFLDFQKIGLWNLMCIGWKNYAHLRAAVAVFGKIQRTYTLYTSETFMS